MPTGLALLQRYGAIRTVDNGSAHWPNLKCLFECQESYLHSCVQRYFVKPNLFLKRRRQEMINICIDKTVSHIIRCMWTFNLFSYMKIARRKCSCTFHAMYKSSTFQGSVYFGNRSVLHALTITANVTTQLSARILKMLILFPVPFVAFYQIKVNCILFKLPTNSLAWYGSCTKESNVPSNNTHTICAAQLQNVIGLSVTVKHNSTFSAGCIGTWLPIIQLQIQ